MTSTKFWDLLTPSHPLCQQNYCLGHFLTPSPLLFGRHIWKLPKAAFCGAAVLSADAVIDALQVNPGMANQRTNELPSDFGLAAAAAAAYNFVGFS